MGCLPRSACLGSLSLTQSPHLVVLGEGLEIRDNQLWPSRLCARARSVDDMPFRILACMGCTRWVFLVLNKSNHVGLKQPSRKVVDMKQMKMDWVPYVPLGKRSFLVERLKSQIFVLSCVQRRAGLKHLKEERVAEFTYCIPYFYNPFEEDETEESTIVELLYPVEPPVYCEFDWEFDEVEEYTNNLIAAEELSEDQKDAFKEFLKEKVQERKRANREARQKRKQALEELSLLAISLNLIST
ncbi:heat intolerant 4-like protein [Tanacetum coccineum]